MRFSSFISVVPVLFFVIACSAPVYRGDIAYITNVPRRVVEREARLLRDRINTWARQVDYHDTIEGTKDKPYHNDQGFAIRLRITSGRRVLDLLQDKLRYSGATVDFTRKEWGKAERAGCSLRPDPGSKTR